MAQRNTRNRIVSEPLFNYSQRRTAFHQISASDPSTTGQTHINYRMTHVHAPVPIQHLGEPEGMEVDVEMLPLLDSSDDSDEDVDEMPGIRVTAKKPRAKRYINTVCSLLIYFSLEYISLIQSNRIRLWILGLTFVTSTWTSSCALKVMETMQRIVVQDVLKGMGTSDVKIVQRDPCGASSVCSCVTSRTLSIVCRYVMSSYLGQCMLSEILHRDGTDYSLNVRPCKILAYLFNLPTLLIASAHAQSRDTRNSLSSIQMVFTMSQSTFAAARTSATVNSLCGLGGILPLPLSPKPVRLLKSSAYFIC